MKNHLPNNGLRENGTKFVFKKNGDPTGSDTIDPKKLIQLTMQGDYDTIRDYLYDYPHSIDMKEPEHGSVGLHVASSKGNMELIKLFHNRGANFNIQDMFGNTPLHYAVDRSRRDAVQLLLSLGSNINKQDHRGNTPLHQACTNNDIEMAKILLKAHAEPSMLDLQGMTPSDKTTLPSIKQLIEQQKRANDGEYKEHATQTVNFMSLGVGLGVGMGMALAKQQQALLMRQGGTMGMTSNSQVLELDNTKNGNRKNNFSSTRNNTNTNTTTSYGDDRQLMIASGADSNNAPSRAQTLGDTAQSERKFL